MSTDPALPPPAPRPRRDWRDVAVLVAVAAVGAGFLLGRASRPGPEPILTGTAASGTLWLNHGAAASNEGFDVNGDRVEVYDGFIVVTHTTTGGKVRHVRPTGYYSNLSIK